MGKSKVMRFMMYGNGVECMRLNGDPVEEVDCFKYLGHKWQRMQVVKWIMWYIE